MMTFDQSYLFQINTNKMKEQQPKQSGIKSMQHKQSKINFQKNSFNQKNLLVQNAFLLFEVDIVFQFQMTQL